MRVKGSLAAFFCALVLVGAAGGSVGGRAVPRRAALHTILSRNLAGSLRASHTRAARRDSLLRLVVVARRGQSDALASRLHAAGARVEAHAGNVFDVTVRRHAVASIRAAAAAVRPQARPYPLAIPGQGVTATNANAWQAVGLNGAGSRVAIIDLGFGDLAQAQAAGEVPANAITVDDCHGKFSGEKHGTAVAEIVNEEAPAALLYLICVDDEATLLQAEQYAVANGVNVINHSVGWYGDWSGEGNGPAGTPDAVAADAAAHSILWVNAAGNDATDHWSGRWNDVDGDGIYDFTPSSNLNAFAVGGGGQACAELRWNEWPNAQHDYDLYLYDTTTDQIIAASETDQSTMRGSPVEGACYTNPGATKVIGFFISVYGAAGSAPLDVFVEGAVSDIAYQTAAGSIVDPAAAPSALAVGAICWQNNIGESFSSRGPTTDGRIKPDLVGPDRVSGLIYGAFDSCNGSGGFRGTSAAAPYVAGAAALVHQRYPSLTAPQLRDYLVGHTFDLGDPGADNTFGAGNLFLPQIVPPGVQYAPSPTINVTWHEGTLVALVTPQDSDTTVTFEYGTSGSYGSAATATATIPANGPQQPVSVTLTGLTPNTTYHFRVVAANLGGKTTGDDQTFTTQVDLPPTVRAHPAVGRRGKVVQLPYTLADDTGEARADVVVYRGKATKVATFAQDFALVTDASRESVSWRAPKKLSKGAFYRFCVKATDRDGNTSDRSCAAIALH